MPHGDRSRGNSAVAEAPALGVAAGAASGSLAGARTAGPGAGVGRGSATPAVGAGGGAGDCAAAGQHSHAASMSAAQRCAGPRIIFENFISLLIYCLLNPSSGRPRYRLAATFSHKGRRKACERTGSRKSRASRRFRFATFDYDHDRPNYHPAAAFLLTRGTRAFPLPLWERVASTEHLRAASRVRGPGRRTLIARPFRTSSLRTLARRAPAAAPRPWCRRRCCGCRH
jgi:hypothetical protein